MRKLTVYLHEDLTGQLTLADSGRMTFQYDEAWLDAARAVPLSHSLPLRPERFPQRACVPFFSGVLPEGDTRATIARLLGMSPENNFALLEALGGECAGAVSLLPEDTHPAELRGELRPLRADEVGELLAELPKRPLLAGTDGYRMSLAGAQNKLALVALEGRMFLPLGAAASTHILKPAIPGYEGIVFNEALCLTLAADCGLPAAPCSIGTAYCTDYLIVERFDRERDAAEQTAAGPGVKRIHQEDFCQALGVRPEAKYQSEGGPGLAQCFALVRTLSAAPVVDIGRLLDAVLFNAVIGNNDAHAKNFAWLRPRTAQPRLAPLYDLVCTVAYPELTSRMAMRIGRQRQSDHLGRSDLERFARQASLNASLVCQRALELVDIILDRLRNAELPHASSARTASIIRERAERMAQRLGARA